MAKLGLTLQQLAEMGISPPADPLMGAALPVAPQQPKKPGFMAPGSKGAMIAGIIGDTLASVSGGQPIFTMNMMQERQRKQDAEASEAQWSRRRQGEREDKQWEWQNKPPTERAGTSLMQNYEWLRTVNPALAESFLQSQATAPPVVVTNWDGTKTVYPAGSVPQGGVPQAPVGRLTPIEGGPGGSPSGAGFPNR
jgi:hypothetical protein